MINNKLTIELPDGVTVATPEGEFDRDNDITVTFDTPEAADELIARVEEAKKKMARPAGMPEDGQEVFILRADGFIRDVRWDAGAEQRSVLEQGNVFFTRQAAHKERERRKALQRVKVWIAANTEPFSIEWEDAQTAKMEIVLHAASAKITTKNCQGYVAVQGIPLLRFNDAHRLIAAYEADLRTLAGVE